MWSAARGTTPGSSVLGAGRAQSLPRGPPTRQRGARARVWSGRFARRPRRLQRCSSGSSLGPRAARASDPRRPGTGGASGRREAVGAQGVSSQTPAAAPGVLFCGTGGGAPGAGTMASPPSPASGGAVPTTPSPPRMRQVGAHCGPVTSPGRSAEDTDPGRGLWAPLLNLVHLVHADTRALTHTHAGTLTDTRLCIARTRRRHSHLHTLAHGLAHAAHPAHPICHMTTGAVLLPGARGALGKRTPDPDPPGTGQGLLEGSLPTHRDLPRG